ncbi:metallophosphoesterase [Nocardioides taihuensis]|uniref:Metallophosphoesterase n=1 Tax=Nocardioides taihuensis TaxID=1835606 RepID=A0ABW0BPI6_9ACTN
MDLSRRNLLRAAGVTGGLVAAGGLADAAVAGVLTAAAATRSQVILKGAPGTGGYRPLVYGAGEPTTVRTNLGITAKKGRKKRREGLLAFAQLTDVHIVDAQSPLRFESQDKNFSSSAYRPQEFLTAHVAEAMVQEINAVGKGPVTKLPLALALQTGDNSDNGQYNEIRWNIDLLDGETVAQDSGDLTKYEGVADDNATYYSVDFWHPHGTPAGKVDDTYRSQYGFPTVPGLLDACRAPFQATGLVMPWYVAMGNHDELYQGNFPHTDAANTTAIGSTKQTNTGTRTVTADPDRRLLSRQELVEEHFTTTTAPAGHGFTDQNLADGTAYYSFDQGKIRFIVLDSVTPGGSDAGSIDKVQFAWLRAELERAKRKLVVIASHHTSWTMDARAIKSGDKLGPAVVKELLRYPNVIAWVNGHTHRNSVTAHKRDGGGGFWEINTAAHIDFPQQSRLIEVADNKDGTLSIFCTMVDHAAPLTWAADQLDDPLNLAALGRELAANDPQERDNTRRGSAKDRNVELLVRTPKWLR